MAGTLPNVAITVPLEHAWQDRPMAETPPTSPTSRGAVLRIGLTPGGAVMLVAAVVAAFALADAFEAAHRTIGWVVACSVVALLLDPVVTFVARLLPRWLSVVLVLIVMLAGISALVAGVATDLNDSLDDLKESVPAAARSLQDRYDWLERVELSQRAGAFVDELDARVRKDAVSEAIGTAPTYVVTGVLMLFVLAYGRRYFEGLSDQFGEPRRTRIRQVGHEAATCGRRYLLVAIGQAVVCGLVVGATCWLLEIPAAFSLGFVAGLMSVLPLMGVLVGGLPAVLLALGLEGWRTTAVLAAVLVALQVAESVVVRPFVDARTVRVGPTVPIVLGLLAFELYGVGGSVYAIALGVIALAALDSAGRMRGEEPSPAVT
jgi:predicted PurR-regulated permease PerM